MSRAHRRGLFSTAVLAALCVASVARADGPYEGTWTGGATRTDVAVHSWGDDCGPRPQSITQAATGTIQVSQEGDNLVFHGRRTTRSNACWSDNRAVHLVSTSVQGGVWRTVCRTQPTDSQAETGTYTLRANGGDSLTRTGVSDYDWQLNGSHCTATATETQTFTRVRTAVVTPPTPTPPEPHPSCTPGAAAHLALRPADATIQPGERTCFRARVTDASGCALPSAAVTWSLDTPAGRNGELADGCFHAGDTAADAEGTFHVRATSGALHDDATVVVHTQDLSDLIAHRGDTSPFAAGDTGATSSEASGVAAQSVATPKTSLVGPLVGAGVALLLVLLVIVVLVSGRKKPAAPRPSAGMTGATPLAPVAPPMQPGATAPVASAHSPSPRAVCPSCHHEFSGDVGFCPNDGARLVTGPAAPSPSVPAQGMICPTCRRGFAPDVKLCPNDSDELVPYAMFLAGQRAKEAAGPSKICPKCGDKYGTATTFCGKDGSELVTVN